MYEMFLRYRLIVVEIHERIDLIMVNLFLQVFEMERGLDDVTV